MMLRVLLILNVSLAAAIALSCGSQPEMSSAFDAPG